MKSHLAKALAGCLAAFALLAPAHADTSRSGASVRIDGARGNVFAAGASVEISGEIAGGMTPRTGVFAAGASVGVSADIDGSLAAAGGDVVMTGSAKQLFLSGGNVTFAGEVDGDAFIAGGNVMVQQGATFHDDAHAAGASIDFAGTVQNDASLAGAFVRLNGVVGGDAEVSAENVVIGPATRVSGDLTYYATAPAEIDPAAQVTGEIVYKEASERDIKWMREKKENPFAGYGVRDNVYGALFWFVALGASGALMSLVFPRWFGAVAVAGREKPLSSLLLGFAVLIALPVAAILFMVIIIGLPFGGFLIALYLGLLCISMIGAGFATGHLLLDRSKDETPKVLLYFVGLAALTILGAAPVVGGIVTFLAIILGLGVLVRGLWSAMRPAS